MSAHHLCRANCGGTACSAPAAPPRTPPRRLPYLGTPEAGRGPRIPTRLWLVALVSCLLLLTACGGGGADLADDASPTPPPAADGRVPTPTLPCRTTDAATGVTTTQEECL